MSEPKLPVLDPDAVSAAIAAIRELNLRSSSIEEIVEMLTPMFAGYTVIAPRFGPGLQLFRMRICDKPDHIGELSYPPPDITPLGRANRPGAPVLYCSTARNAPFFESRPKVGQTVAIVSWVTTAPLLVNHVGYTAKAFQTLKSNRKQTGWGPESVTVPVGESNLQVAEFLAEIFTRAVPKGSEYLYKLSVAIAEKLCFLDGNDVLDGLLYPTIQMWANADNIALKPRYADNHLRFVKAEFAFITAIRESELDINVVDTATELASDGKILWKGHSDRWTLCSQGDELHMRVENGKWVARDAARRIVDPD